jgi:hypothetical protein
MTDDEVHELKELAAKAHYLARQRDIRRISDAEYIELLNALREQHGLRPIVPLTPDSHKTRVRNQ